MVIYQITKYRNDQQFCLREEMRLITNEFHKVFQDINVKYKIQIMRIWLGVLWSGALELPLATFYDMQRLSGPCYYTLGI